MKKLLLIGLAIVLVGVILYSNIQQQKEQSNGKRNVYVLLPLTGILAQPGQDYKKAMEVSYKKLNNPQINLVFLDSEFKPSQALSALRQASLNDENPLVLAWTLAIASAVIPQVGENGFVFAGSTVEYEDLKKNKNYERISTTSIEGVKLVVKYLQKNSKRIVLVHSNDVYGHSNRNAFENEAKKSNLEYSIMDFENNTLSAREFVQKLLAKNENIDSIFISAPATHGFLEFFKELKLQGYKGKIIADIAFSQKFVFDELGDIANEIVFVTLEPQLNEPRTKEAVSFRKIAFDNGLYPSFTSIEAYDMVTLINYMVFNNIPFSQESFMNMKKFDGVSGQVIFPNLGDSAYPFILATIKNGEIIPVESETK